MASVRFGALMPYSQAEHAKSKSPVITVHSKDSTIVPQRFHATEEHADILQFLHQKLKNLPVWHAVEKAGSIRSAALGLVQYALNRTDIQSVSVSENSGNEAEDKKTEAYWSNIAHKFIEA